MSSVELCKDRQLNVTKTSDNESDGDSEDG